MDHSKISSLIKQWFRNQTNCGNYFDEIATGCVIDGVYDLEQLAKYLVEKLAIKSSTVSEKDLD